MRILLTGATGSLGAEVLARLYCDDNEITCVTNRRSPYVPDEHDGSVMMLPKDRILKGGFMPEAFDCIIHCATQYGRHDAAATAAIRECNIELPLTLFELGALKEGGLFINSDTFFNTQTVLPGQMNLYAQTKATLKKQLQDSSICQRYCIFNAEIHQMFGEGDDGSKFIPTLLSKILAGDNMIPMTEGAQTRDFISTQSVAEIYQRICYQPDKALGFHHVEIGNGIETSIREFAHFLNAQLKAGASFDFGALAYRDNEIMNAAADTTAIQKMGYKPQANLNEIFGSYLETIKDKHV